MGHHSNLLGTWWVDSHSWLSAENGPPQEAAAAAMGVAFAVVPYCLAKAVSEYGK